MTYVIRRAIATPELRGQWDGAAWAHAAELEVSHFHSKSSSHRPLTRAKLLYDDAGIYVHFRVADRYVKCLETQHQGRVWRDSCAEFFVQPKPPGPYFNIEMNCGGTMLLYCIPIPPRGEDGRVVSTREAVGAKREVVGETTRGETVREAFARGTVRACKFKESFT